MNKLPEAEHAARMELYLLGLTDAEISRRLYITPSTICIWRKNNGLPRNFQPRKQRDRTGG